MEAQGVIRCMAGITATRMGTLMPEERATQAHRTNRRNTEHHGLKRSANFISRRCDRTSPTETISHFLISQKCEGLYLT